MPITTDLEFLHAVRAKLSQGWTQQGYARDKDLRTVPADSADATCWCILGAAIATAYNGGFFAPPMFRLLGFTSSDTVIAWNDEPGRTQEEVLALFDKRIAQLEAA